MSGTTLTVAQFLAHEGYITWADQHQLIQNALDAYPHEGLGILVGRSIPLASHGTVGIAAQSSPTLFEGLTDMVKYHATRAQFSRLCLGTTPQFIRIVAQLQVEHDAVGQFLLEALSASMKLSFDVLLSRSIEDVEYHFSFSKPTYHPLIESTLAGKVLYDQPKNQYLIPKALGACTLPSRNEGLRLMAQQHCETLFRTLRNRDSYTERVKSILRNNRSPSINQEDVAALLNVSTRTLLRRLKDENTSYKEVVDQQRKSVAEHYLTHSDLSIETIAACMEYHDISSFRRAFKRWFGIPPSEYPRTID